MVLAPLLGAEIYLKGAGKIVYIWQYDVLFFLFCNFILVLLSIGTHDTLFLENENSR